MVSPERKGLTGEDISEEQAKQIIQEFTGAKPEEIASNGFLENGNIPSYSFIVKTNGRNKSIAISQKGGHIVYMNSYREINEENIIFVIYGGEIDNSDFDEDITENGLINQVKKAFKI